MIPQAKGKCKRFPRKSRIQNIDMRLTPLGKKGIINQHLAEHPRKKEIFMTQQELLIPSTLDGTLQPSLFYRASAPCRPLLVGLHTWSYDRFNQIKNMLPLAEKHDFNLLLPDFRGANTPKNPHCTEACGSLLARTAKNLLGRSSGRFLLFHSSLFTKSVREGFWQVISNSE